MRKRTETEAPGCQAKLDAEDVIRVYVSSSRRDVRWFRKGSLITALARYLESKNAGLWYDQRRFLGERASRRRSEGAIDRAHIALVLISPHSLESPFIQTVELPRIEYRAAHEGLIVIPLLLEDCDWESLPLPGVIRKQHRKPKPLINYVRPKERWQNVLDNICGVIGRHIDELRYGATAAEGQGAAPGPATPPDHVPLTSMMPAVTDPGRTEAVFASGGGAAETGAQEEMRAQPPGQPLEARGAFPSWDQNMGGGGQGELILTDAATSRPRTVPGVFALSGRGKLPKAGDLEAPSPDTADSLDTDSEPAERIGQGPAVAHWTTFEEEAAVQDQLEFGEETYHIPVPAPPDEGMDTAPEAVSRPDAPGDRAAEEPPAAVAEAPEPPPFPEEMPVTPPEVPEFGQRDLAPGREAAGLAIEPERPVQEQPMQLDGGGDETDLLEWEAEEPTAPMPAPVAPEPLAQPEEPQYSSGAEETVEPRPAGTDQEQPEWAGIDTEPIAGRTTEPEAPPTPMPRRGKAPGSKAQGILGGWMRKMRGALGAAGVGREGATADAAGGETPEGEVPYIDAEAHERKGMNSRAAAEDGMDVVDCTVFAPEAVQQVEPFQVQVFLHTPEQALEAAARAARRSRSATRRAVKSLETGLARGARVVLTLAMPGVRVEEPAQAVVWNGVPESALFSVVVPLTYTAEALVGTMAVSLDGIPVGHVRFALEVIDTFSGREPSRDLVAVGDDAHRYTRAFLSYAPEDAEAVLARAAQFKALGIELAECSPTRDSARGSQEDLHSRIDGTDLFVLCWSEEASRSETVRREVGYVLDRGRAGLAAPTIHPVAVGRPPLPDLWDTVAHLHFAGEPDGEAAG